MPRRISSRSSANSRSTPPTSYYTPPQTPALTIYKKLEDMDKGEAIAYQEQLIQRLALMQTGIQQYLDRRAARGTHTPTDTQYENNVALCKEIEAVLGEVLEGFKMRFYSDH